MFFVSFQAEDGIRDLVRSRGLGDVYKRQVVGWTGDGSAPIGQDHDDAGTHDDRDVRDVADEPPEVVDEVDDVPPTGAGLPEETVPEVAQGAAEEQPERDRPGPRADLARCLLYTSPSPRDRTRSRMPSSA